MNECKILRRRCPVVAYLLITDRCNMHCRYCFLDYNQKRRELSTEQWLKLIDELHSRGTAMFCFMGGEPLLHPDIDLIVKYVLSKDVICDMTSNGILVPEKIDTVKNIDSLMISLDGDTEANDINRGRGAFDKAIEAIRIAKDAGVVVRVNAVMTKQSKERVEFLLALADRYDLYVTFSIAAEFPVQDGELERQIMLDEEEIRSLYKKLKVLKHKGRRILLSFSTLDYVINYPLPYNKVILRSNKEHRNYYTQKCFFGQTMLYVDANGDLYPCATLWNNEYFKPKNILEDSFQGAWDNMAELECLSCFCPGGPEWNRIMSLRGFCAGVAVTLQQALSRKAALNIKKRGRL